MCKFIGWTNGCVVSCLPFKECRHLFQNLGFESFTIAMHRGFEPHSGLQVSKKKMFLPRSLVKIQYCGEPPWPRGSVLGGRPPGLECRILCLESSVISFTSPSSGGSPAYMCTKMAYKNPIHLIYHSNAHLKRCSGFGFLSAAGDLSISRLSTEPGHTEYE